MNARAWDIVSRVAAFALVFAILGGVYLILTGPLFKIQHVYIQSSDIVKLNTQFLTQEQNLLFLDEVKIVRELRNQSPLIKNIKLIKKFPNGLIVELAFREPVATIENGGSVYLLDNEGMVLPPELNLKNKPLPRIDCSIRVPNIGQQLTQADILNGLQLLAQFSAADIEPQQLTCEKNQLHLVTNVTRIIFLPDANVSELANSLQFLFKQFRIEGTYPFVVDLRFSKPVLIKDEWHEASGSSESADPNENIPAP